MTAVAEASAVEEALPKGEAVAIAAAIERKKRGRASTPAKYSSELRPRALKAAAHEARRQAAAAKHLARIQSARR